MFIPNIFVLYYSVHNCKYCKSEQSAESKQTADLLDKGEMSPKPSMLRLLRLPLRSKQPRTEVKHLSEFRGIHLPIGSARLFRLPLIATSNVVFHKILGKLGKAMNIPLNPHPQSSISLRLLRQPRVAYMQPLMAMGYEYHLRPNKIYKSLL